jgi:hypothetical protein
LARVIRTTADDWKQANAVLIYVALFTATTSGTSNRVGFSRGVGTSPTPVLVTLVWLNTGGTSFNATVKIHTLFLFSFRAECGEARVSVFTTTVTACVDAAWTIAGSVGDYTTWVNASGTVVLEIAARAIANIFDSNVVVKRCTRFLYTHAIGEARSIAIVTRTLTVFNTGVFISTGGTKERVGGIARRTILGQIVVGA